MSLDGGLGAVTENKNINLIPGYVTEKLTSVLHHNGQDYWVLVHQADNNSYCAYKVTAAGVDNTPVVTNIGAVLDYPRSRAGNLKFYSDGSKFANPLKKETYRGVELFDFDNSTGIISNYQFINDPIDGYKYGVEFSPSGDLLYITGSGDISNSVITQIYLLQYDLTATDIAASVVTIFSIIENASLYFLGSLQIAPDGMIYLSKQFIIK